MGDLLIIAPCIIIPYIVAFIIKMRKMPVNRWLSFIISGVIVLAYLIIFPIVSNYFNPPQADIHYTVAAIIMRIITTLMLASIALFFQWLFNFVMRVKYK